MTKSAFIYYQVSPQRYRVQLKPDGARCAGIDDCLKDRPRSSLGYTNSRRGVISVNDPPGILPRGVIQTLYVGSFGNQPAIEGVQPVGINRGQLTIFRKVDYGFALF